MNIRIKPLLFLLLGVSCVPSYSSRGPLLFSQVPYTSPSGENWPSHDIEMPEMKERFHLAKTPQLHYVELNPQGSPTIVFVHGLGSNLKFWRYQLDHYAAQGYRVLAADMLGYGKSSKPGDFPYTMPAMAEVLHAFMEHAKVDNPILVGHSMGGHVSMAYVIAKLGDVQALVLVSPAGLEKFSPADRRWFTQVFTTHLVKNVDEEALWTSIRYNNFSQWKADYNWLISERIGIAQTEEFDAYAYANVLSVHGLLETDYIRDNLNRIQVPTLLVFGHDDRLIPNRFLHGGFTQSIMEFAVDHIPNARLKGLSGCGHTLQIDCADQLNPAITDYLAKTIQTDS